MRRQRERQEDYWKSMTRHSEVPFDWSTSQGRLDDLARGLIVHLFPNEGMDHVGESL